MAKRRGRTPLYDLIGTAPGRGESAPRPALREDDAVVDSGTGVRRSVRIPIGYFYLAIAAIVILCVLTYIVGFRRAESVYEGELDQERFASLKNGVPRPTDPLSRGAGDASDDETMGGGVEPFTWTGEPAAPAAYGQVESDPRKPGLNYFVLITTNRDGARKVAEFCRDRRLEAYVVPVKNSSRNFQVIVLPGYAGGDQQSAAVQVLRQSIDRVIEEWHAEVNPRDNFGYYPVRFDG